MMVMQILRIGLPAAVAAASLVMLAAGVRLMSRGRGKTMRHSAVIRRVAKRNAFSSHAEVTVAVDDAVLRTGCLLTEKHRAADVISVLWQEGDKEAVAEETIRTGESLVGCGAVGLLLAVLLFVLLKAML